jgi:hypothetical protein
LRKNSEPIDGFPVEKKLKLVALSRNFAWGILAPRSTPVISTSTAKKVDGAIERYQKMILIGEDEA